MRVLLVEHESEEAQRMAQGLNEAGYTVEVAANGMAALRFVESTEYDLVILDVMLPGLNAWKLQQAIRLKFVDAFGHRISFLPNTLAGPRQIPDRQNQSTL